MSYKNLLKQSVQIFAAGTKNKYGRDTPGAATEHKARVDLRTRTRHDSQGNLVTMAGQIFLLPDAPVDQGSRIDFDGHQYQVVHTYKVPGGNGSVHHIEADIVEYRG